MGRKAKPLQTNFVAGECDPKLRARSDVKQYYQGTFRSRNVFVIPQGGERRRPALVFAALLSPMPIAIRCISFQFSTEQTYLLLVTHQNIAVYKAGVFMVNVPIPHTADQLRELSWTQSLDTLILFHPDVETQKVQRAGSDILWNVSAIVYANKPTYYFERTVSNTLTLNTAAATTATAGGAEFSPSDVGKFIRGGGGYAEITAYTNPTTVTVVTKTNFIAPLTLQAGAWNIEEFAWSATRGWPSCGTFHQGRLIVAGSRQRPQTLWGSRTALYFDFDASQTLDDFGFESTADSDTVSAIQWVYSGRHLVIGTNDSEWYIPVDADPLVPKNQWLKRATRRGSSFKDPTGNLRRLPVVEVDGGILFVQAGGKAVREFLWDDPQQDYGAQPISLLSSHLLRDPVDFALRKATNTEEADFGLVVNADGTLTVLCTLRDQQVTAWTMQLTDGLFKAAGVDGERMYFVIERTIAGVTGWYLEYFDDASYLDCSKFITLSSPTLIENGFDHLDGHTCKLRIDGANAGEVVPVAGQVTLPYAANESIEVGLGFPSLDVLLPGERVARTFPTPLIITLPIIVPVGEGSLVGDKKRVAEVVGQFHETQVAMIMDERCRFMQFDVDTFDTAPPLFTGDYVVSGLMGYDEYGMVWVYQDAAGPFTLLGLKLKVDIV